MAVHCRLVGVGYNPDTCPRGMSLGVEGLAPRWSKRLELVLDVGWESVAVVQCVEDELTLPLVSSPLEAEVPAPTL